MDLIANVEVRYRVIMNKQFSERVMTCHTQMLAARRNQPTAVVNPEENVNVSLIASAKVFYKEPKIRNVLKVCFQVSCCAKEPTDCSCKSGGECKCGKDCKCGGKLTVSISSTPVVKFINEDTCCKKEEKVKKEKKPGFFAKLFSGKSCKSDSSAMKSSENIAKKEEPKKEEAKKEEPKTEEAKQEEPKKEEEKKEEPKKEEEKKEASESAKPAEESKPEEKKE